MPARILIVLLLLALTGWSADEAPFKAEVDFGKKLVADLQARRLDAIEAQFDRTKVGDGAGATLATMAMVLPADTPTAIDVAGLNLKTTMWTGKGKIHEVTLSLQYQFGSRWFRVDARWRQPEGGARLIEGFHITPLPASLQQINGFTLASKSLEHYAVLALAIALPVFTLAVVVVCVRTPMRPLWHKALWIVAILFGMPTLTMDWTTGATLLQLLRFQIGSAAFFKAPLGPLLLSISLPLGAIVFLYKRRSLLGAKEGGGVPATTS